MFHFWTELMDTDVICSRKGSGVPKTNVGKQYQQIYGNRLTKIYKLSEVIAKVS